MDRQDSSVPDHDPATSSMPRIPIPDSADVPAVVRERYDEADALMANVDRYAASERQAGALDVALRIVQALRADLGPEVLGTPRRLEYQPGRIGEVLAALDQLAGQAPEDGERS